MSRGIFLSQLAPPMGAISYAIMDLTAQLAHNEAHAILGFRANELASLLANSCLLGQRLE
jgi:hypothetical protein